MSKTKPQYPEAFKQQLVELHMAGRTPAELSREFGVSAQRITPWVARAAADTGKPARGKDVLSAAQRDELARLRRRVRQLEQERDMLAKATASSSPARTPRRPSGLRTREREPSRRPSSHHVPRAAHLHQRLLRDRAPSNRALANAVLTERIRQVHADSQHSYGMPRVRAELIDQGLTVSCKRVARLMRAEAIRCISCAACAASPRCSRQRRSGSCTCRSAPSPTPT
jgi:transposase